MTVAVCQLFETCTEIEQNQMFKSSQVECGNGKFNNQITNNINIFFI